MRVNQFLASFRYAYNGIATALKKERNMRFHVCVAFYVYLFSMFYDFEKAEYALLTLAICGVLALELVNSSLERAVERPSPDRYMTAGVVKDMAAGAVLVFSIGAAICGGMLFWDIAVIKQIASFFAQNLFALFCLVASAALALWFIFGKEEK